MRLQRWVNVRTEGLTEVAEASVESRITQTGAVGPVAAPVIGTITLFITLLPIEALRTACTQETTHRRLQITTSCCGKGNFCLGQRGGLTILAHVSTDPGWTAAAATDWITAGTILTLTGEGAVLTKISLWTGCENNKKGPLLLICQAWLHHLIQ